MNACIGIDFLRNKTVYEAVLYLHDQEILTKNKVIIKWLQVNSSPVISEKLPANTGVAMIITEKQSSTGQ